MYLCDLNNSHNQIKHSCAYNQALDIGSANLQKSPVCLFLVSSPLLPPVSNCYSEFYVNY